MCLYPTLIKNRKYEANKKNGGNVPPLKDQRAKYVPVGCGQCIECRKQKAREWQIRLQEDIKTHKNGKFITLTYSNEWYKRIIEGVDEKGNPIKELEKIKELDGYERDNAIATATTRLFLERWRKEHGKSLRHWLITELGHNGTENIHMHGIIWTNEPLTKVEKAWKYGWMWKGKLVGTKHGKPVLENYVSAKTINYIIKYVTKRDEKYTQYRSKILTSPGIGKNYTEGHNWKNNLYKGKDTEETYKTETGHKIAMPTYWRNKIYTDEEREQLWLQRLDKQKRWICGEQVDVSKNMDAYYKILNYHREKSKKLGYGDRTTKWEQKTYEIQRRNMMNEERIKEKREPNTDKE